MSGITKYFRCFYKTTRTTRSGTPMLAARLMDSEREYGAVAFGEIGQLAGAFEPGDVVRATGELGVYDGKPQLRLQAIECRRAAPPAEIVPPPKRDVDELLAFARHFASEVRDEPFSRLLFALFDERRLVARWRTAPATTFSHHAYVGGLLEHTVAVATIADELCCLHSAIDRDLLVTAALLHDVGRARIFPRDDLWTRPGRDPVDATIRMLGNAAKKTRLPRQHWLALAGAVAFGATRSAEEQGPTLEATALRCADLLDSTVGDAKRRRSALEAFEAHRSDAFRSSSRPDEGAHRAA